LDAVWEAVSFLAAEVEEVVKDGEVLAMEAEVSDFLELDVEAIVEEVLVSFRAVIVFLFFFFAGELAVVTVEVELPLLEEVGCGKEAASFASRGNPMQEIQNPKLNK
jgi:hypothetical protein